ncbi:MAG: hypothetical protein HRU35_02335 [Rickettsiaceae bacterium]|nr:hypothetical protein [Rickettsiaceae bacterium]
MKKNEKNSDQEELFNSEKGFDKFEEHLNSWDKQELLDLMLENQISNLGN